MALAATPQEQLSSEQVQLEFYGNLARLRDDVLAKRHPRLSLPDSALKELRAIFDTPAEHTAQKAPGESSANVRNKPPSGVPLAAASKSEDLIRAEILLQRQRIEKTLAQAVEQKGAKDRAIKPRDRDHVFWEGPHTFDAGELLEQTLKALPHVSGWMPVAPKSPSPASSFDENEYYSSQVMSAATSHTDGSHSQATVAPTVLEQPPVEVATAAATAAAAPPPPPVQGAINRPVSPSAGTIERRHAEETRHKLEAYRPVTQTFSSTDIQLDEFSDAVSIASSSQRDESYSPPAADAFQRPTMPQPPPPMPALSLLPPPPPPSGFPMPLLPNLLPGFVLPPHLQTQILPPSRGRESESYSPPAPVESSAAVNGNSSAHNYGQRQAPADGSQNTTSRLSKKEMRKREKLEAKSSRRQKKKEQKQRIDDARARQEPAPATGANIPPAMIGAAVTAPPVSQQPSLLHLPPPPPPPPPSQPPFQQPQPLTNSSQTVRKRRRETNAQADDDSRHAASKRVTRMAESPEPYIKPEPISPPPLSVDLPPSDEPPRRLVLRDDGRPDIETESPGHVNGKAGHQRQAIDVDYPSDEDLPSPRYAPQSAEQSPYVYPAPRRRVVTQSGDLRRVASYQNAMRPPVPDYPPYPADDLGYMRAPSRVLTARPVSRLPSYYEPDQYAPQYRMPAGRYEAFDDNVQPRMMERHSMTPLAMPQIPMHAKRKIVVDEFGDEWVAVRAPPNMRHSMARDVTYEGSSHPLPLARSHSSRVPPQATGHAPTRMRQTHFIDLDDDDVDEYSPRQAVMHSASRQRMARPVEMTHPSSSYASRQPSRVGSLMPMYPRDPYQAGPPAPSYEYEMPTERYRFAPQERSYSTRPEYVQQQTTYGQSNEYDPRAPTMLWQQPR